MKYNTTGAFTYGGSGFLPLQLRRNARGYRFKRPIEYCVTFFPKSSFTHTISTVHASSFGETRPASVLRILLRYDRSYPVPIPDPCIGCLVQGASAAAVQQVFSMRIREVLACPKCGIFSPEVPTTYEANVFYAHMSALQEAREKYRACSFDVALRMSLLSSSYSICVSLIKLFSKPFVYLLF